MAGGRFKDLLKKYGKVAIGVHVSVSAASITGLYIAIKNNVDVESMLQKYGMPILSKEKTEMPNLTSGIAGDEMKMEKEKNRTVELAKSSGGAFALAFLISKALFPVKVPITLVLTPPVARFLARRNWIKT